MFVFRWCNLEKIIRALPWVSKKRPYQLSISWCLLSVSALPGIQWLTIKSLAPSIAQVAQARNTSIGEHRRCCVMHQSIPPAPSPPPSPRATAGHLATLSVLGVGHLQILHCPGAGHLLTPGPFASFWHARGFLSEYNYTEGFTGKKADWLICQGQE